MAMNYRRMGQVLAANKVLGMGVAISVILALLSPFTASLNNGVSIGIGVGIASIYKQQAISKQGAEVTAHRQSGGKKGSAWAAAGIGLLSLIMYFVLAVPIYLAFQH